MIGLDANVIVRYLVRDDKRQAAKASAYILNAASINESLFINNIVLCELVWVLESCDQFSKEQIVGALEAILITKQFEFENKDAVRQAVSDYSNGKADFADYLIGRSNLDSSCDCTVTFDRSLKNADGFELLK